MGSTAKQNIVQVASSNPDFSTLVTAVKKAGLVKALSGKGPYTVFAPTDEAFAKIPPATLHSVQDDPKLLATVLTYHVVAGRLNVADLKPGPLKTVAGPDLTITKDGDKTLVNGTPIVVSDIGATNGVIQVVGDVLLPAFDTIVGEASTLAGFSTLVSLVAKADLVKTLSGTGPFTVFAPIDDAFAKVPKATLDAVGADTALLTKVLTYHVVPGKLTTADLKPGKLATVNGASLTITNVDGKVLVDGHPIALANVPATNGVIQVMGDVLLPPA
jgi:uncharacterized surface protein with fasciclin (FAS1) repeats